MVKRKLEPSRNLAQESGFSLIFGLRERQCAKALG